ncbi:hypothetical protein AQUSIP_09250 [Aquicella siphonis]|uniref:Uncharacterized protein n=1 Tax=Aquicella siphonis TaxID=254247 RepID=A0A5E4PG74_9COXI|nr:DUF5993 family protein [Aquicella siphonis]VVC75635.1 hypothetical protein AQUSIP_09250 [Aquicella siphonis]
MMVLLFLILLAAVITAWTGYRQAALNLFTVNMVLAVVWFLHHVSSQLTIQL